MWGGRWGEENLKSETSHSLFFIPSLFRCEIAEEKRLSSLFVLIYVGEQLGYLVQPWKSVEEICKRHQFLEAFCVALWLAQSLLV
jgi:hypothetical protein